MYSKENIFKWIKNKQYKHLIEVKAKTILQTSLTLQKLDNIIDIIKTLNCTPQINKIHSFF